MAQKKQTQLPAVIEQAKQLQIVDKTSLDAASDFLVRTKRLYKEIEAHYDNIIKPIKKNIRNIELEKREKLAELDKVIDTVKGQVAGYISAETERQQIQAKKDNALALKNEEKERKQAIKGLISEGKVEQALELKKAPILATVHLPVAPEPTGGVYKSELLDYTIENLDKIPNEYFKPRELDTKKIREAGHEGKEIPGIRFFKKISIGVNA